MTVCRPALVHLADDGVERGVRPSVVGLLGAVAQACVARATGALLTLIGREGAGSKDDA